MHTSTEYLKYLFLFGTDWTAHKHNDPHLLVFVLSVLEGKLWGDTDSANNLIHENREREIEIAYMSDSDSSDKIYSASWLDSLQSLENLIVVIGEGHTQLGTVQRGPVDIRHTF